MIASSSEGRAATAWPLVALAAAGTVGLQLAGLYAPRLPSGAVLFPGADKVAHAIGFALPVVLVPWADALRRRAAGQSPRARLLALVVGVSAAHAVVSELIQHLGYAGRTGDPLDVLADWSGIAVGGLLAKRLPAVRPRGRGPGARPDGELVSRG